MRLNTQLITNWRIAMKVSPIRAKHVTDCINQTEGLINKLLIRTLEGDEPMQKAAMVCIGEAGDIWMQNPGKLLKKYTVVGIEGNGWLICEPKPENEVHALLVTEEMVPADPGCSQMGPNPFTIVGQWGEVVAGEPNVQRGVVGDFICQNISDPTDVWIVKRRLFLNTYQFKT